MRHWYIILIILIDWLLIVNRCDDGSSFSSFREYFIHKNQLQPVSWQACEIYPSKQEVAAIWQLDCPIYVCEEEFDQDPIPSKLRNWVNRPLPIAYRPEVEVSPLLDSTLTTRFQNGLDVLQWIVELGRTDTMTKVLMLLAHNAMPREARSSQRHLPYLFLPEGPLGTRSFHPQSDKLWCSGWL